MSSPRRGRWFVLAVVGGLLGSGAALAQDAPTSREWKVSVAVGPAYALGKAADLWVNLVRERSGGALAFRLHPGASLAQRDPDREFAALRDGSADLAVGSTLHWAAQVNELAVVGLPWLAPEEREVAALATGPMRQRLFDAVARAGAVPLALATLGHRAIATRAKEVRVPDDLRGLKVRVAPVLSLSDLYEALGARPFAVPFSEAADQLRSGGLDAQEGPIATFAAMRLDGLGLRNVTLLDGVAEIAVFAVNRSVWNGWTESERKLVGDAAVEAATELVGFAHAEEEAALATLKSRGFTLLRLTGSGRAAFALAARPAYDKWAAIAGDDIVRAAEGAVRAAATQP